MGVRRFRPARIRHDAPHADVIGDRGCGRVATRLHRFLERGDGRGDALMSLAPSEGPNSQYNFARPDSLSVRVAARVRRRMFERFMRNFSPDGRDDVLDIGVTSDRTYESSNYFEAF